MLLEEIGYVAERDRISCWKRQNKLLEEIGYVVETVSIFGCTTAVVHAVVNCYTPTIIQTYDTPSLTNETSLINTKKGTGHCQSPRRERYKC